MPFPDPEIVTRQYMEDHDIAPLFEDLLSYIMFNKPDDPSKALAQHLEDLKELGRAKSIISTDDLEAMFGMFDITHRQVVTVQQANAALRTILGPGADISTPDLWGSTSKPLDKDNFVKQMTKALELAAPKR